MHPILASKKNTVVYMTEPSASFVSLVKRGANRTPFRIVKGEKPMPKIIQRIVAKSGIDETAIKSAIGPDASDALNMSNAKNAGSFVQYEQHPEEAFKSDSLEVVSLADDNAIMAVCGELIEKSDGFVGKLLARKQDMKGIEVPDTVQPVDAAVLKADLSSAMWAELDSLAKGLSGILGQNSGENSDKLKICNALCDNFLNALDASMRMMKSQDFDPKPEEDATPVCSESDKAAEPEKAEEPAQTAKQEQTVDHEPVASEAPEKDTSQKSEADQVRDDSAMLSAQMEALTAALNKQLEDVVKSVKDELGSLTERVSKMEKSPAAPVESREDPGYRGNARKSQNDSVFKGIFGDFR